MDPYEHLEPPRTELRRSLVADGLAHEVTIAAVDGQPAALRLDIIDPDGRLLGQLAGEVPIDSLTAAAGLIAGAMTAAAAAHGATGGPRKATKLARKRQAHPNHGTKWTEPEEVALAERFRAGATVAELSQEFGRNDNSIRARLVQLELLSPDHWPAAVPDRPTRSRAA